MSDLIDRVRATKRMPPPQLARAIREAAGLTQQQIAAELGVTKMTVCHWEAGRRSPDGEHRLAYSTLLRQLQNELSAVTLEEAPIGER